MTAELFTQLLVNGLAIGLIYVLVASGLIILLGVVRIFNFAHAEFYMLGAFITFGACEILHLNFFLSIAIAVVVVTVLGALCYRFIFRYLQGDILLCTGASIGLSMILMRGALLGFGTQERGLHPPFPGNIGIGFVTLPAEKVIAIVLCLAVMIGLYFLLMRTKIGKAMRAVKQDTEVAALQGINTKKIYTHCICIRLCIGGPGRRYSCACLLRHAGHGTQYLPQVFNGSDSGRYAEYAGWGYRRRSGRSHHELRHVLYGRPHRDPYFRHYRCCSCLQAFWNFWSATLTGVG